MFTVWSIVMGISLISELQIHVSGIDYQMLCACVCYGGGVRWGGVSDPLALL